MASALFYWLYAFVVHKYLETFLSAVLRSLSFSLPPPFSLVLLRSHALPCSVSGSGNRTCLSDEIANAVSQQFVDLVRGDNFFCKEIRTHLFAGRRDRQGPSPAAKVLFVDEIVALSSSGSSVSLSNFERRLLF